MAGAAFGEVQVSFFVAGAAFGEVQVSFFVAGAVLFRGSGSLSLGGSSLSSFLVFRLGWGLPSLVCWGTCLWPLFPDAYLSWLQDGLIAILVLAQLVWLFFRCMLVVCRIHLQQNLLRSIRWCWRMTSVAPRIVNNVSCVTRINPDRHFSWQAQYLVMLEGNLYCSAHCK